MHSMLAAAPIGIAFSRQRRFELVSAEFARLLSQTPDDLCGQLTKQIFASDADYDDLGSRVVQAFAQHGRFDDELRFIRRDGSVFWGRIQGQPVDPANEHGGTIWLLADITRERSEREQLSWSASHDALTGVHNRRALEAHLGSALAQRPRLAPLALLFIDLDRFKQVNDSAGHAAGDQMLCAVAQVLLARVRGSDMAARIGGDEFAVLLQGCEYQAALAVAEQIRMGVEAIDLEVDAVRLGVGASVGVAELDETVSDVAVACALADAACYKIKRDGRSGAVGRGVTPPRLVVIGS
jgi:diguanylate cyclase (GGDEF)-like protein/PAS domain S-box-containing protein